jgi:hypothetical protein
VTVAPAELIPLRTTCQMTCEEPAADNKWESPPYNIHNFDNSGMRENRQAGLGWKTIAPSARKWLDISSERVSTDFYLVATLPVRSGRQGLAGRPSHHLHLCNNAEQ